ncbi:carbon-nitrogen hydrolase family protein [Thermanaeromonas sp. C210]|uniref:carbon-nitrogen hydrolase family protein n=1 Tax=Thermanaeromonas sp. C210 TaxID=2731925 RepID=UPI00155BC0E0|nr:carbon-nitrogen hydrolase family protein [Thermanaeromonas sp. C210]GFN24094.1 nitrilase [Thermanaeromonas sp. C210]
MREFIAAGIQLAPVSNNVEANLDKALVWLPKAVDLGAELVIFPETTTTGFETGLSKEELWDLVDFVPGKTTEKIQEAAAKHRVYVVWPTYERGEERGVLYNSAFLIGRDGKIIGAYRKTHPFGKEMVQYGGWTTSGDKADVFETDLGTIGIIICYDGDFPDLSTTLALKGAEVIVRPSALLRTYEHWWATNFARAYDNHVYMIAVNAVGGDAGGNYYFGHSMIIAPNGWKLAQGRCAEEIIYATLKRDALKYIYGGMTSLQSFDHLEDRNLSVYDVMRPGRARFQLGRYIREGAGNKAKD